MNKQNALAKALRSLTGLALAAGIISFSTPSLAAPPHTSATVTLVNQSGLNGGFGTPGIFINATNSAGVGLTFFAGVSIGSPCSAHSQSVETLKGMLSVAQAALLSGKKVNIYYNDCGTPTTHYIIGIDMFL